MKIDTILWDADETLLEFDLAETISVKECLKKYGYQISDEQVTVYKAINQKYWEMLERGEIEKQNLGPCRYQEFLDIMGITDIDAAQLNTEYQETLGQKGIPVPGSEEVCGKLKEMGIRQYIVTNGTPFVQYNRLRDAKLDQYMEKIFVSEELGAVKPEKAFFDLCTAEISDYRQEHTMIVGDSLTSDMAGGNHAGIRCCWYNPKEKPLTKELRIDYKIRELREVLDCLE